MGFSTSLANEGDEHDDDDDEEEEEEAEEEEEEAMAGGGGGEAGAEALSKRAVKRQRKRELSEAAAIAAQPIASGFGHRLLVQMGWGGTGTPLQEGGIASPVAAVGNGGGGGGTAALAAAGGGGKHRGLGLGAEGEGALEVLSTAEVEAADSHRALSRNEFPQGALEVEATEAADGHGGSSNSKRQRRQKEPTAAITTRIPAAEAVDDPWLAMPRMWRVELRMATPSDEIDVRRALEKTRGVAEVLRAEPVD